MTMRGDRDMDRPPACCPTCHQPGAPIGRRVLATFTDEHYQCPRCDQLFVRRVVPRDDQDERPRTTTDRRLS